MFDEGLMINRGIIDIQGLVLGYYNDHPLDTPEFEALCEMVCARAEQVIPDSPAYSFTVCIVTHFAALAPSLEALDSAIQIVSGWLCQYHISEDEAGEPVYISNDLEPNHLQITFMMADGEVTRILIGDTSEDGMCIEADNSEGSMVVEMYLGDDDGDDDDDGDGEPVEPKPFMFA